MKTLTEAQWRYKISEELANSLRKDTESADLYAVQQDILNIYDEIKEHLDETHGKGFVDESTIESYKEDVRDVDVNEDEIDMQLELLYDLCDNIGVFIEDSLEESIKGEDVQINIDADDDDKIQRKTKQVLNEKPLKEDINARPNHEHLLDLIEQGLVDTAELSKSLLYWLSDDDIGKFIDTYEYTHFDDVFGGEDPDELPDDESLDEDTTQKKNGKWVNHDDALQEDTKPSGYYGDRIFRILDQLSGDQIHGFIHEYEWDKLYSDEIDKIYDKISSYLDNTSGYSLYNNLSHFCYSHNIKLDDIDESLSEDTIQKKNGYIVNIWSSIGEDEDQLIDSTTFDDIVEAKEFALTINKGENENYPECWADVKECAGCLEEATLKQKGNWVNKGKEGSHGVFKTKKQADAQRKAMFANGFKGECLEEEFDDDLTMPPITSSFLNNFKEELAKPVDESSAEKNPGDIEDEEVYGEVDDNLSGLNDFIK